VRSTLSTQGGRDGVVRAGLPRTSRGKSASSREKSEYLGGFRALCRGENRSTPGPGIGGSDEHDEDQDVKTESEGKPSAAIATPRGAGIGPRRDEARHPGRYPARYPARPTSSEGREGDMRAGSA
jgi:hypothetical protein